MHTTRSSHEFGAFATLSAAFGWLDDNDDWVALRPRCLGAAARGGRFDQPGSLTFLWKDGRTFAYDHHSIAEIPTSSNDPQ